MESVLIPNKPMGSLNEVKSLIGTMINHYEFDLRDLVELHDNSTVEDYDLQRNTKVQSLCLQIAGDLTTLTRYKIDNPTDYFLKIIDPALTYLRDLRSTITLYLTADRA